MTILADTTLSNRPLETPDNLEWRLDDILYETLQLLTDDIIKHRLLLLLLFEQHSLHVAQPHTKHHNGLLFGAASHLVQYAAKDIRPF